MTGCGGCAARAARRANAANLKYEWTSADGSQKMTYDTLMQAKAKVMRKGGTYTTVKEG